MTPAAPGVPHTRSADEAEGSVTPSRWRTGHPILIVCTLVAMIFAGVGLWFENSRSPMRPASLDGRDDPIARLARVSAQTALPPDHPPIDAQAGGLPSVEDMITRLARRLEREPGNAEGWRMLGWSYANTGRFTDAITAYAKAIALQPDAAEFHAAYGEAIVRSTGGTILQEARQAFTRALELDPKNIQARYFRGLANEQDGSTQAALTQWTALLVDLAPDDALRETVERSAVALARELGVELAVPERKGPTVEDIRNALELPVVQQQTMIRGMVESLARRLESSPRDEEGWIRLIRSHLVLGDRQAAQDSLRRARLVFSSGTGESTRIEAAAREMGVRE